MKRNMKSKFAAFVVLILMSITMQAQNWPQWHGENFYGVAEKGDYPVKISSPEDILWEADNIPKC